MQALHSSSALACNVFEYWRDRDRSPLAKALELTEPVAIRFEQKFSTGLGGTAPNLDVVLTRADGGLVAIESKFCEPFGSSDKRNLLKPRYFVADPLWSLAGLPGCQRLAERMVAGAVRFELLDAAQLLKHMLGLARTGLRWKLLCLWYRPQGRAGDQHAAELERFVSELGPDATRFECRSYQELLARLESAAEGSHAAYLDYLRARYFGSEPVSFNEDRERMAGHTSEERWIERRRVKVASGTKSQTVNVCTPVNSLGTYEQVYRIYDSKDFVSPSQLPARLAELDPFLVSRGAIKEGSRRRR